MGCINLQPEEILPQMSIADASSDDQLGPLKLLIVLTYWHAGVRGCCSLNRAKKASFGQGFILLHSSMAIHVHIGKSINLFFAFTASYV